MRNFIQQFKIPFAVIVGFVILGVIITLKEKPSSQPILTLQQPAAVSLPETLQKKESTQQSRETPGQRKMQLATVTFVVDGDTVEIQTGERVRLVGIDAPERDRLYYIESKNKLSEMLLNKEVSMEKDISNQDRYGRLLRYLWVGDTLVNLEMVKQGFASVFTYPPDVKYSEYFLYAQQEARRNLLGLWASPPKKSITSQQNSDFPSTLGFTVPTCSQLDCDCADFTNHAHAQWFYKNYDLSNIHYLDSDGDGFACESLP